MKTILKNYEGPYCTTFTLMASTLRSVGVPVLHIRTAINDKGIMMALITYLSGAEQRVTVTNLTPADAMFKVLQVVKETYFSEKAKNKE